MIQDDELRGIFKTASEEHLQNLDSGLLHLEKHPDDQAMLEELLREAHSLKGDANMLGVKEVGTLAHQIEHLLTDLRQHHESMSLELSDRLVHGLDAIRALVDEAVTGKPAHVNTFRILAELMGSAGSDTSAPGAAAPVDSSESSDGLSAPAEAAIASATPGDSDLLHPDASLVKDKQASETVIEVTNPSGDSGSASPAALTSATGPNHTDGQGYRIETIRVATQNLDSLLTQAGELTVTKIRVAHRLAEMEAIADLWEEWNRDLFNNRFLFDQVSQGKGALLRLEAFHSRTEERLERLGNLLKAFQGSLYEDTTRLELISDELEEGIRTLRLLPLSTIFTLFPRMVRDLARQEDKQVELVIEGGDTRADKRILEEMKDPLMHMIRNAIDHGIESPAEREQRGKPATATLKLRGYQTATSIVIEIQDDGRGLDTERIKAIALKRGLCREEELANMTASQIHSLIFSSGFSTAPLVTEVSGRGVGLDVVRTNVENLKGSIQVESTPGQGCTFRVHLGLTLATAHVLLVQVQDTPYALPVEFVNMACLVDPDEIFTLEGRNTIVRNNQPISVMPLADLLDLPAPECLPTSGKREGTSQLSCIILEVGSESLGIFVDSLVDEQDVVIKSQSRLLKRVRNVSGATILGTGEVCMVLNPQDLIKSARRGGRSARITHSNDGPTQPSARKYTVLLVEDSIATRTQEKRILEAAGYEVVTAVDGVDGFSKLQARPFDAVVSDVQMPNMDGLTLAARIRQHQEYNEIPIILVTSLASDEDKRRGADAGANAYITKGNFNQAALLETLHRLV
jgi:two-component system chemotaxis sensor kinase CheA